MAWTDIPAADIDQDSPITQTLMTALRDNPEAIANGDSGAPQIVRGALSTGTNSVAYSFGSGGGSQTISLDPYSFFPSHSGTNASGDIRNGGASADSGAILVSSGSTASGTVYWRYILA